MNSIPKLTGDSILSGIPGRLPSYLTPRRAADFPPVVLMHFDSCFVKKPPFYDIGNGHQVACYLHDKSVPQSIKEEAVSNE